MQPLIVVSGVPRSGTSMMMAALQAGGVELLTDESRPADGSNPRGYFEYQPVLRLDEDNSWLRLYPGRAVKIIYRLLPHLSADVPARVVMMHRKLNEVAASQAAMLGETDSQQDWVDLFRRELTQVRTWLESQSHLQVLDVFHGAVLRDPAGELGKVADFLERPLDVAAMAAVVDPTLYRQRGQS